MSGPVVRRWQNSVPMPCGGSFAAPAAGEEVFPGGHRGGCVRDAAWVLIGEDGETAIGFRCDECRKREGLIPTPAPAGWEVAETVGRFPVEPLVPPAPWSLDLEQRLAGLSAAQRRLVGEGWRFVRWGARDASVALMISPGDVSMWCYPNGSKVFGDDGEAARQTREARADRFERRDGAVEGVDIER